MQQKKFETIEIDEVFKINWQMKCLLWQTNFNTNWIQISGYDKQITVLWMTNKLAYRKLIKIGVTNKFIFLTIIIIYEITYVNQISKKNIK